jgi:hypothetical protein
VLVHVPERLEAIGRLVRTLRPGGWLLIADGDGLSMYSSLDPQTDDPAVGGCWPAPSRSRGTDSSKEELEHFLGRLDDPEFVLAGPLVMSAWGRRPD